MSGLVWVMFGVLGFLWGGLIMLVLWEELSVLSMDFSSFVLGGEEYLLGVELGGKGMLMSVVLMLIYAMVMVFSMHYMGLVVGGGYFNWMIFSFVVGVVILLVGLELYSFLVGWEILGVVSFILIGYYCSRSSWGSALITVLINRLGDIALGFMFWGLLVLSGSYWGVFGKLSVGVFVLICMITKSAQIPFGGWLPLAMAAPTPVSALVHSSTLVIAGLYLGSMYGGMLAQGVSEILVVLGVGTLVASGFSSLVEMDFKKVVAYSTSMHLGLMVCMGILVSWLFMGLHMGLHAVFKSLLFVGVGLVIMMVFHDQDFRGMVFGGEWAGVLVIVILSSLWSLLGLTYFSGWVTKDGYMEFLTSESLGFVLWLVSMVALSSSGVYCFKLGSIVVGSSVGKMSLIQGWYPISFGVCIVLIVVSMGILGIVMGGVMSLWYDWGFSVGVVGVSEKMLYFMLVVLMFISWFKVGQGFVGSGFSLYLQGVFQYLMNDVSWISVGVVSWVEWVWLASFVESSVSVLSWVSGLVGLIMVSLDWYFLVIMVVLSLAVGCV